MLAPAPVHESPGLHSKPGLTAVTPQSTFMIAAPVPRASVGALKSLLDKMNFRHSPGMADPNNSIVPFAKFVSLHYARFVILDDRTLDDFAKLRLPVPEFPILLAFMGECDGPAEALLQGFDQNPEAAAGLREIFGHCDGFVPETDLLPWMKEHTCAPAAVYVNWVGRTVWQIREEAALHDALRKELDAYVGEHPAAEDDLRGLRDHLRGVIDRQPALKPTPPQPTPFGWWVRNLLHFAIIPIGLLILWILAIPFLVPPLKWFFWIVVPFLVLDILLFLYLVRQIPAKFVLVVVLGLNLIPFFILFPLLLIPMTLTVFVFLVILRHYEKGEPEIICRPTDDHTEALARQEDHDVSNQFNALGSVKPNWFRRWTLVIILWLIDYAARHFYTRGHLGRVQSIHFARWVYLDQGKRVLFASNYDGSHEHYMDDFINKVGWGLNLAFGGGIGYPRTNWLIEDGAKEELKFKYTQRRHQVPSEVWYKAYPGLTAFDLARNTRVREGLERRWMAEDEIRAWLRDL